ncbi:thioredoxin family protein [Sphingobacterium sp. LRF_L2]|uniref:thioredoxin family protein n=1 Tax=Sphingobacterium sp. LRF_L2 TaxID=3369421 RepID=UPI003F6040D5
MKKLFTLSILLYLAFHAEAQKKESIQWLSFEQLSDSLASKPKDVLLFFHTDWCVYCRKMQQDVFTNSTVIDKINREYYAVHFDAESVDTVSFDGQHLTNTTTVKRRGSYHSLAKILASRNGSLSFPTTLILNADFTVHQRHFQYLSPKTLLKALEKQ